MSKQIVRVAVGVVRGHANRVLIALRPSHKHQGDLWEFPGGKIEPGETCEQALVRELDEELGIAATATRPLIQIPFAYPDKTVLLDVLDVLSFVGEPQGKEGQSVRWVQVTDLGRYHFPAANRKILKALKLPPLAAITGEFKGEIDFTLRLERAVERGAGLLQLRFPESMPASAARQLIDLAARKVDVPLTVNSGVGPDTWTDLPGLHLRSRDLMRLNARPVAPSQWLGASCHNLEELKQAAHIDADYVYLSPVSTTSSHPIGENLGWNEFGRLVQLIDVPAYALGGLKFTDLEMAQSCGARGIAGIGLFGD